MASLAERFHEALGNNDRQKLIEAITGNSDLVEAVVRAIREKIPSDLAREIVMGVADDQVENKTQDCVVSALVQGVDIVEGDGDCAPMFWAVLEGGRSRFGENFPPESLGTRILGMCVVHPRVTEAAELVFRVFRGQRRNALWRRLVAVHALRDAESAGRLFHEGVFPYPPGHALVEELVQFGNYENLAGPVQNRGVFQKVESKLKGWDDGNDDTKQEAKREAFEAMRCVANCIFRMCEVGSEEDADKLLCGGNMVEVDEDVSVVASVLHLLLAVAPSQEFLDKAIDAFRADAPRSVSRLFDWGMSQQLTSSPVGDSEILRLGPTFADEAAIRRKNLDLGAVGADASPFQDVSEDLLGRALGGEETSLLEQSLAARIALRCCWESSCGRVLDTCPNALRLFARETQGGGIAGGGSVATFAFRLASQSVHVVRVPAHPAVTDKLFPGGQANWNDLQESDVPKTLAFWAKTGARLYGSLLNLITPDLLPHLRGPDPILEVRPFAELVVNHVSSYDFASFGSLAPVFLGSDKSTMVTGEESFGLVRFRSTPALPMRAVLSTFLGRSAARVADRVPRVEPADMSAMERTGTEVARSILGVKDSTVPEGFTSEEFLTSHPVVVMATESSFGNLLRSNAPWPGHDGLELEPDDLTPSAVVALHGDERLENPIPDMARGRRSSFLRPVAWRAVCVQGSALRDGVLGALLASACRLYSAQVGSIAKYLESIQASERVQKALEAEGIVAPHAALSGAAPRAAILVLENARRGEVRALEVLIEFLHRPSLSDTIQRTLLRDLWASTPAFLPEILARERASFLDETPAEEAAPVQRDDLEQASLLRDSTDAETPIHAHSPVVCGTIALCRALRSLRDGFEAHGTDGASVVDNLESIAMSVVRNALEQGAAGVRNKSEFAGASKTSVVLSILIGARENGLSDVADAASRALANSKWAEIRAGSFSPGEFKRHFASFALLHWRDQVALLRAAIETTGFPDSQSKVCWIAAAAAERWYQTLLLDSTNAGVTPIVPPTMVVDAVPNDLTELVQCIKSIDAAAGKSSVRGPFYSDDARARVILARYVFLAFSRFFVGAPVHEYDAMYFEGVEGVRPAPFSPVQPDPHAAFIMASIADRLFRNPDNSIVGPVYDGTADEPPDPAIDGPRFWRNPDNSAVRPDVPDTGDVRPKISAFFAQAAASSLGQLPLARQWDNERGQPVDLYLAHRTFLRVDASTLLFVLRRFQNLPEDAVIHCAHAWFSEQKRSNAPVYTDRPTINAIYRILRIPYAHPNVVGQLLVEHGPTAPPPPEVVALMAIRDAMPTKNPDGTEQDQAERNRAMIRMAMQDSRPSSPDWDRGSFRIATIPRKN